MQIQRSFKGEKKTGVLYLVPTPIGNREDMSYRMVQTLKDVDLIAAEDTRNTGLLLKHFEIRTPQTSFHEHNAQEKIPDLIAHLESGKDLAQVSDAGLPSISDQEKVAYPETQIFYESPHRVKATLENMLAVYGDRPVVLVRELTKIYEEYTRGNISELVAFLEENPLKGECLLIVEGAKEKVLDLEEVDLIQEIDTLVQEGMKKNQAIKQVAKQYGLQKSELYARYHQE